MKKILFFPFLLLLLSTASINVNAKQNYDVHASIETAYKNRQNNVQLKSFGKVEKILPDDTNGSRHQKFIVRINATITVLIAHNIDIAKRIPNIKAGDTVEFYGEYEWNKKGGVVHWTHHDPKGKHITGWIKHNGITYE